LDNPLDTPSGPMTWTMSRYDAKALNDTIATREDMKPATAKASNKTPNAEPTIQKPMNVTAPRAKKVEVDTTRAAKARNIVRGKALKHANAVRRMVVAGFSS